MATSNQDQQQATELTTLAALAEAQGVLHEASFNQWKEYLSYTANDGSQDHRIKAVGTLKGALQDRNTKQTQKKMAAAIRATYQEDGRRMSDDTKHLLRLYEAASEDDTAAATMQRAAEMCKTEDGHLEPLVATAILIAFKCEEAYRAVQKCAAAEKASSKQKG